MNLLILEESEKFSDNFFELDERKSNHIINILKSKEKDTLNAGILGDKLGIFTIEKINNGIVFGKFTKTKIKEKQSEIPKIRLFSSIQRPQTIKKILQLSSSFGISEIFFFTAEKAEKSYLNSPVWKKENIQKEIILGLEQGKRIFPPKVEILKNKKEIEKIFSTDIGLAFHPSGKPMQIYKKEILSSNKISILFGPESGLNESEIEYFQRVGFFPISLSRSILRTETALAFSIAQLEYLFSEI